MKKSIQHLFGILIPMRFFALALWKDSIVKICASVLLLLLLFSIFVFIIFPDAPRFAVTESLAIGNQPPGFQVTLLRIVPNSTYPEQDFFSRMISGPASNDLFIPIISHQYDGNDIVIKEYSASGDSSFVSRYNIADVIYPVNMQKEITERNGQLAFEKSDGTPAEESINLLQGIIDGQNISTRKFIQIGRAHV